VSSEIPLSKYASESASFSAAPSKDRKIQSSSFIYWIDHKTTFSLHLKDSDVCAFIPVPVPILQFSNPQRIMLPNPMAQCK
jgi:hypothetical protein